MGGGGHRPYGQPVAMINKRKFNKKGVQQYRASPVAQLGHCVCVVLNASSKGGQTGTLAESVPVCPPWPKMSQIALQGGQTGTAVPDCPPWRAIWGQPPALGKKEGGKQIWSQGGQSGRLLTKIVPRWRIFSAILNLFFCLIAGKRGCGLRLFSQ